MRTVEKIVPVPQVQVQEVTKEVPEIVVQKTQRQVEETVVQDVFKEVTVAAPQPVSRVWLKAWIPSDSYWSKSRAWVY